MNNYENIPQIDLSPLWDGGDNGLKKVADEVRKAYTTVGFSYLINYNISREVLEETYAAAKEFLTLPLEKKLEIKQNKAFRGYVPLDKPDPSGQKKINQLEAFVMTHEILEDHPEYHGGMYLAGPNQWPKNMAGFKKAVISYRDHLLVLSERLVTVFSIALGLGKTGLDKFFINPTYVLRLQYYPEQPKEISSNVFGLAPHTDYGLFTILSQQSVDGLEVKNDKGEWLNVPYKPNTLILNSGDILKRWSNNTFKSALHRVVNRTKNERYSIPFFFEPNMHSIIEVLQNYQSKGFPPKYRPIKYGDYLLSRLQNDFGALESLGY